MLVLTRREIQSLLDLDALIEALAPAMADLSAGRASVPLRVAASVPESSGILGAMPGYLASSDTLATKLVSVFPENAGTALPTHQAVIAVFDAATGTPLALMDGSLITATRTAAGSALATRTLAREDASVLAIVGTGVQARSHAEAVTRVRPVAEIRIAGRDVAKAESLARELRTGHPDIAVSALPTYREAIEGAGIVCATTHSPEPVVRRAWLDPGAHVNSVGLNPGGREVDGDTVRDALVVVEWRQAALAPFPSGSNELLWPIRDGLITEDRIAELGEVLTEARPGRTSDDQISLYKSVGVAVQDAAAAGLVLAAAKSRGAGLEIDLAG